MSSIYFLSIISLHQGQTNPDLALLRHRTEVAVREKGTVGPKLGGRTKGGILGWCRKLW